MDFSKFIVSARSRGVKPLRTRGKEGSIFRDFVRTSFVRPLIVCVLFWIKIKQQRKNRVLRNLKGSVHQKFRSQEERDLPIVNTLKRWFFI